MQRYKPTLVGLLVVVPVFTLVAVAHAQSFRSGDTATVPTSETVDGSLYVAGQTVDVAGTVNGDVFCAGQTVTVSGTVNGDVLCAGQTVRVSGTVNGDVRVAGQTVTIDAAIQNNLTAAGQTVTIDGRGKVGGDATIGGQTSLLNGSVGRDLTAGSNVMTINGQVGRTVQANVERLHLGSGANIGGDVLYTSKLQADRDQGAQITGQLTRQEPKQPVKRQQGPSWPFILGAIAALIVAAFVLALLMPRVFVQLADLGGQRPLMTVLVGLATAIVTPIVILIIAVTVIGIPLALLALLAWLMVNLLAGPVAAFTLGRWLLHSRTTNVLWFMLAGAAILSIVCFVPFIGWLVSVVALWFGIGTIVRWISKVKDFTYHTREAAVPALDQTTRPHRKNA